MKLLAFTQVRPGTNLIQNELYTLPKERTRSGFLGIFNKAYPGDARKTLLKIALGAIMDTTSVSLAKPSRPTSQEERAVHKMAIKNLREWENKRASSQLSHYTVLRKVNGQDAHFVLSLPIFRLNSQEALNTLVLMFSPVPPTGSSVNDVNNVINHDGNHTFDASLCVERAHLGASASMFLSTLAQVTYQSHNGGVIAYLDFKIRKDEAESLVSMDWMEIRPVDLYPLMSMWVEAEYESKSYGKSAISLSKIADTLPQHLEGDERIDEFGIGIDMSGDPVWIPSTCNNTAKYEALFTSAGAREDGFSLKTLATEAESGHALPANIPIFVDWVNNKFVYSQVSGKPYVMPLEHVRKCTPSMAMNLLSRDMPETYIKTLAVYAAQCGVNPVVNSGGIQVADTEEAARVNRVFQGVQQLNAVEFFARALRVVRSNPRDRDYVPSYRDLTNDPSDVVFKPLSQFVQVLYRTIVDNLDSMYVRFAVSTITEMLGLLAILACYGRDMATTQAKSNTSNAKAEAQGLDPSWTPPAAPMITAKFGEETGGLLPHQGKVRNLLRESPDYAMLSVDAGGGKSSLAITDILYEIKANRSAPYLILCPAHLVANYVSEIVEFTDGKVNCIPVTSYNIRTSGLDRYEDILKTAPINTILVVDYDVLKFRGRAAVYGTTSVAVYPVIELLRKFKPGYCLLDESHFLRNAKSARFKSVMSLIADIPKKRLASGTINPDSPSDLPGQVAIMDPTIFGSRENFNETYGLDVRGDRVMSWRQTGRNSVAGVMTKLKTRIVWASAKRKEWACALPPRQDRFIPVELSEAQQRVYTAIFDEMVASITRAAATNKGAQKLLDKLKGKKASAEDEDTFGDLAEDSEDILDDEGDAGPSLQPYLADIERFVTNPAFHPYARDGFVDKDGNHVPPLRGDDLMPPKARVLAELMRTDYDVLNPSAGKVLIFVNYNESARSTFEAMPKDIQACGLLYAASDKTEMVNRFKTDPKVRWMIGIRKSLEVGLNLQQASVLVRLENVWTPGEQEQGDSRIARPYFGPGGDQRRELKFDTIVANRTIDITKAARLRAKMVALAKFENTGNPNYEAIPDIPIIPMTLDAIQGQNDFNTNLAVYQQSMAELNRVIREENEEYKSTIIAEGGFKFTQVAQAHTPEGCALLSRVPYAQGTELYAASELGLVRVDNYLGMDLSGEDEEEDEGGEDEADDSSDVLDIQRDKIVGLRCHTEYGDGEIIGAAGRKAKGTLTWVRVSMDDGSTARVRLTTAFIVTRNETNGIDMRNKLAKAAGLMVTAPITVPAVSRFVKPTRVTQKQLKEQERQRQAELLKRQAILRKKQTQHPISVSLQLNLVNGFMQVGYLVGKDKRAVNALEALGFKLNQPYYYTRVRSYKHLIAQANRWAESGFEITNQVDNDTFQALTAELAGNSLASHRHYARLVSGANFQNYLRQAWKPSANKKLLNLFALITDGGEHDPLNIKQAAKTGANPSYGIAYLCMPAGSGHAASKLAISSTYASPGTSWRVSAPMLAKFVGSIAGVHKVINEMREAGVTIENVDELNMYARSVKKVVPKTEGVDVLGLDYEVPGKKPKVVPEPAPARKTRVAPEPTRTRKSEPEPAPKKTRTVPVAPVKKTRTVPVAPPVKTRKAVPEPAPKRRGVQYR